MRPVFLTISALAVIALTLASLVIGFGLFDVSARRGHLPGVSWVLHTAFRNAVELRAPPASAVPDLASPDMIALGARHFDGACRTCHGAPGAAQTATVRAMVPRPPHIQDAVKGWQPRHLFWIVRHGAKMTGMPAWPAARRTDDIWPVIAFLEASRDMSGAEYQALIAPPDQTRGPPDAYCATCHGNDGAGRGNAFVPRLDILTARYGAIALSAYRDGQRQSGIMAHAASQLSDEDIASLARQFARGASASRQQGESTLIARGRALAIGGANAGRDREIPACAACHGPWPDPRSAAFPDLVGQREAYILAQIRLWRDGLRGGAPDDQVAHRAIKRLSGDDMRALAVYYSAGAPEPGDQDR